MKKMLIGIGVLFILMITGSTSYYFLSILPTQAQEKLNFEKQKFEAEQKEKEDKKKAEEAAEQEKMIREGQKAEAYEECVLTASTYYREEWDRACMIWKQEVDQAWKRCRSNQFSFETDAENKQRCVTSTPDYKTDDRDICLLPSSKSDSIEKSLKERKDECFKLYSK